MLTVNEAKKIGINACIDKIGRDFVSAHKETATSAYGNIDGGVFCFVGVDTDYVSKNSDEVLFLDSESKFSYRASCNVSLADGVPAFIECIVPN